MTIEVKESLLHWNYFLALEKDLEDVSRYVEFSTKNFRTYSIELAHLLLASASEFDVIAKGICGLFEPDSNAGNIHEYHEILMRHIPEVRKEKAFVPRFGLTLRPWMSWKTDQSPFWWRSYNKVKHQRDEHYTDANLKNALNSMAGLFIAILYYYKTKFADELDSDDNREITRLLKPESELLRFSDNYYYGHLLI